MKKSSIVFISLTVTLAACRSQVEDHWVSGYDDPNSRDTVINNTQYRRYHGAYYMVRSGLISPSSYHGSSIQQISQRGYSPARISRGGFGGRASASA